ncbi:FAD-binding oxidoreductase [Kribbella sp. NPDC051952]|uniref:FAD-binding oxidoreductase n=1 Tax=Kribbella sp. NPDC051952 TaxID=3154851 RepID=UPI00342D0D9A
MTTLEEAAASTVRIDVPGFRGELVEPGDPGYDEARAVYNGAIDRRPRIIARCVDTADVMAAVTVAQARGLTIAVRGGGHNAGGLGVWDDALVVDLSAMHAVHVDPAERLVRVEGGAVWADVDHATHPFGLAVPSGWVSSTGVGGLTLGGGIGYLARQFGLTIDCLLSADVVLADGTMVTADAERHPDLFWALRGGGGNFGIVTSFVFRGQPVRDVVAGPMMFDINRTGEVLRAYDRLLAESPETLSGWFGFFEVPPAESFPVELHGRTVAAIMWCYNGPAVDVPALLAPLRALEPLLDGVGELPWPALQSIFDPLLPAGMQWYWRADFVDELTDEAIAIHVDYGSRLPTPLSTMHLYPVDGAAQRVGAGETAYAHRQARYCQVIVGVDPDPANLEPMTEWAREYHDALHPHSAGGAYVNMMMDDEGPDRVRASYRENFERLVEIKRRYDPDNALHINQNISPNEPPR